MTKFTIFKSAAMVLLLAVAIIGCDKSTEVYRGVDSAINIQMIQRFDNSQPTLELLFETTTVFPYANYRIDLSWQKSSNIIDIVFKGVVAMPFPVSNPRTAIATIDFGTLSNGTYQLNFRKEGVKYSGELIVSYDNYTINFPANPTLNFINSPLNKIPKNTIWGFVGYFREETLPLVQSFFTALMELGATKRTFTPGYYTGGFKINKNGDFVFWGRTGFCFVEPFIFHFAGDITDLDELFRQWHYKYGEHLNIIIYIFK